MFAAWKSDRRGAGALPERRAKVGGIQMVVNGFGWHEREQPPTSDELLAANRDWYLYAIEQFGPARCMFESNFPVDRLSCSYTVLWNQFKKLTKDFSAVRSQRDVPRHRRPASIGFPERDACAVSGMPAPGPALSRRADVFRARP